MNAIVLPVVLVAALLGAAPVAAQPQSASAGATANEPVVTIVKVPPPWYAAEFLLPRAFRKAVPQYAAIEGLQMKAFTVAEDGRFGGAYLWRSRTAAQAWFGPAWQQRVRASYGQPSVDWYTLLQVDDGPARATLAAEHAEAVITLVDPATAQTVARDAGGLVQRAVLRDAQGRTMQLLLWQSLEHAIAAVGDRLSVQRASVNPESVRVPRLPSALCAAQSGACAVEYFDAPVLLWPAAAGR